MTRIQELRSRVVLLKRHVIEEADGSFREAWQKMDMVWARVVPYVNREVFGEGWNNMNPVQAKYKVTIRCRRGQFARVKWGDVTLALLCPPLWDQRRQWMTCLMYAVGEDDE